MLTNYSLPQYSRHRFNTNWLELSSIYDDVRETELNEQILEREDDIKSLDVNSSSTLRVEHCYINLAIT